MFLTRDVRNRFLKFRFSFLKKTPDSDGNEFDSVQKTRFSSDIIVIYYSFNIKHHSDSG